MPTEPIKPDNPNAAPAQPTLQAQPVEVEAVSEAGVAPSKARKKKPNRILRAVRNVIRAIVVVILLIALAGALVYFTPLSPQWAANLLKNEFSRATGLQLEFALAEFTLSRGQIRIESPSLLDPETRTSLIGLDSVECFVDTAAILSSLIHREPQIVLRIDHISAMGPLELRFNERDGKVALSDSLARLARIGQEDPPTTGTLATDSTAPSAKPIIDFYLGSLDLENVRVELVHLSDDGDQALARISDADLRVEFEKDSIRPKHVLCHGKVEGVDGDADFKLDLQPNGERNEIALDLTVQPFDTNKNLLTAPKFHVRTSTLTMRGMLRQKEAGDWALHTDMEIPRITLADVGEARKDYDFEVAKLYAELQWSSTDRQIRLADVQLTSREGDLNTKGRIELFAPYRYAFNVDSLRLRDRALELMEQLMVKEELLARPIGGSVEVTGTINGRMEQLGPDEITLDYTLGEIALAFPDFPEPITDVQLQGSFRNHEFLLTHGQARVQDIPVEFTGGIRGRLIEGQLDHAEVSWKTSAKLKDVSDIVRRGTKGPVSDFKYKGNIEGAGAIRFDNPEMGDWKMLMEKADIEGWLKFTNAELRHADLKEPIRDLNGQFSYTRSTARLQNISGRMDSVPFVLDGVVSGSNHFWNDPRTSATLETTLNLADRDKYFDWLKLDKPADLPEVGGRVDVSARVGGPLSDWRAWAYTGTASIADLAVPLDTRFTSGTLTASRIDLAFTPRELRLQRADAQWQGVTLNASGTLGLNEGHFAVTADGPMTGIKAALAKPLSRFIVDGSANGTGEFVLTRNDAATNPVKTFADFIPKKDDQKNAVTLEDESTFAQKLAEQWTAEGGGQILLTNVEFTQERMPTRLMEANGKLRYDLKHLWNDGPITIKVGEKSSGNLADIEVVYGSRTTPTLLTGKVTGGHFDVDQWVSGWKKIDRPPPPLPPEERVMLQIDVAVATNSVSYRGLQGTDLNGTFHFTDFTGKRHILWVENATARMGEGDTNVNIRWEHFTTNDIEEYDIKLNKFDVAGLLRGFTSIKSQGGIASGLITGNIKMSQVGKGKNPFNGSGSFVVENSRFVSNAILGGLGKVLRIEELFNDISFPKISGEFDLRDSAIVMEGNKSVVFENPALLHPLDLKVQGMLKPGDALNLNVSIRFLPRVGNIPVIGRVWDVVNTLTGKIFSYNIRGTIDEPQVSVIPLN